MSNTDLLKNFTGTILLADAPPELAALVQEYLAKGGFLKGTIDGKVGPITMTAFHAFKKANQLGDLDYLGKSTAEALVKLGSVIQPTSTKLDVDYFYQRDNSTNLFGTGDRQCKLTCSAMLAHHLLKSAGLKDLRQLQKEGGYKEPESVYAQHLKKYGDTIYNEPHIKALKDLSISAYYKQKLGLEGLIQLLQKDIPVPLSIDYKQGGHIVLAVGYNADKNFFWIHDPYGSRDAAAHRYRDRSPLAGRYDTYSWDLLNKLWANYWNGHALIATAVGGKSL
ncbi:MAG: hypothetical protein HC836_38805 [Richelia sp. RM2_1_2]|nr:hypothetical protein [Richelia sp. RM1_1_1]NJO63924.1 hypothetical protein [Richelia sp. RM2_1_2]